MRITEYLPYVLLTAAGVFFVRAVTAESWSHGRRRAFTAIMAVLLFLAIGVYWLRTGEKPDETLMRLVLCPFLEDSERCKRALAAPDPSRPREQDHPRIAMPQPQKGGRQEETDARCAISPNFSCLAAGSIPGFLPNDLSKTRCGQETLFSSDRIGLQDIWTTSVYSYAPGGGGPGGGEENDALRVGGWGDWYHALMKFEVPSLAAPITFAAILLNAKKDSGTLVSMQLDRITQPWSWKRGDRLWWKDKPSAIPVTGVPEPKVGRWYAIDVTDMVEGWRSGRVRNYGLQLRPTSNNNNYSTFYSSRAADKSRRPLLLVCT